MVRTGIVYQNLFYVILLRMSIVKIMDGRLLRFTESEIKNNIDKCIQDVRQTIIHKTWVDFLSTESYRKNCPIPRPLTQEARKKIEDLLEWLHANPDVDNVVGSVTLIGAVSGASITPPISNKSAS